ncbi:MULTISPECIES: DUF4032 domain-containing protein [Trueperella]|uniref:DUF4032 domain-containing protein n=1 Tax=Trueperella bernardiae TaxID=59561 RepID=A0A0W1KJ57_9ACTO|nr:MULTISPECIES: DUF4032 domain-containing protein [Trueperella]KTF03502.1 hypothetical protein AQZ59_01631 [Trueperella bernardiae]MCM3908054.1 DUF4032 domain-containing protein [Trueperella bernardiae]MDK8602015.1 DUF4032 domain-containing protein [Trueperella bernardiae]MDV6239579.1 DUF4032 domain-containing protein [Trueperella bernardiae]OCW59969.1 lipopolysaccharide kinase [Trueperella bernardiae]
MIKSLQITSAQVEPALLDLPWNVPLEQWPTSIIAALPRGISRHIVRFAYLEGKVVAVKEIGETVAHHEYETLRDLNRIDAPCVEPIAVITGRFDAAGEPLNAALVTQHLPFSLPYRSLFGQASMRIDTVSRLIDALAVLMVRLHLLGFYWGDVSLSNALFRRDAGEFSAYLVDAETGELEDNLSEKKRNYDIDVARVNIIGELMDLQAGSILDPEFDAIAVGNRFEERYLELWDELTSEESFDRSERWRVDARIRRLNDLGFEVGELAMSTDIDGTSISIQPKVVDLGHYSRKLMRLTGLDVEEKQARRLVNDMESYRTYTGKSDYPLEIVAHEWMTNVYEPTVQAVPPELRTKLQPAQLFHEILEHRWFMSERQNRDVPMREAVNSYVHEVLTHRRDESQFIGRDADGPATEEFDVGTIFGD